MTTPPLDDTGTVAMTTMLMMPNGHSLQSDGDNSGNGFLYSQIIAYPDYLSLAQLYLIYHTHQIALQHIGGYDMYSLVSFSMYCIQRNPVPPWGH